MRLEMHERLALTDKVAARYRAANKKEKSRIIDDFILTTSYNRKYTIHLLATWGTVKLTRIDGKLVRLKAGNRIKKRYPQRGRYYDSEVEQALIDLWPYFDYMCGKRLVWALRTFLEHLRDTKSFPFAEEVWEKLSTVSAATIDRLLKAERKKFTLKGRSHTQRGTLLKHEIPIRTFADWNEQEPGFVEIDLVGHDGGNSSGEFAHTLTVTDIATGWTEVQAVKNKARKWVYEALLYIRTLLPFPLKGIDCDNGSEFINAHLFNYCKKEKITFTRARPYRKNDNCFVEQKNNVIVRRTAAYYRYDTEEEVKTLNQMYQYVRLWVNFFHPSVKLVSKTRRGSKVQKTYDLPQTPYQRVLLSAHVEQPEKDALIRQFQSLNIVSLKRAVDKYSNQLARMVGSKNQLTFNLGKGLEKKSS